MDTQARPEENRQAYPGVVTCEEDAALQLCFKAPALDERLGHQGGVQPDVVPPQGSNVLRRMTTDGRPA